MLDGFDGPPYIKTARLPCGSEGLSRGAKVQADIYRAMTYSLLNGRQQASIVPNALDSRYMPVAVFERQAPTKMPQKVCNYRKPKVYWFGELHGSNNFIYNPDFVMSYGGRTTQNSRHWTIGKLTIEGRNPEDGLSVFVGHDDKIEGLRGKRFIGISEPDTDFNAMDSFFLKKVTGDDWVETRTLKGPLVWEPQGEIIFMGGSKPLKINEKSKETIEQVKRIEYPVVPPSGRVEGVAG